MARKTIIHIVSTAGLAAVLGSILTSPLVAGAPPQDTAAKATEPSRGAVLFRLHCASCHGPGGRGDGPVAEQLATPPPDLTRIAARRDGRFSTAEVERLIDGRTAIEPHGTPEMPVWGLSFRQPGRLADQEEEIWLQIRQLVRHLRSIQTGPVIDEG